jgi:hypothetical protein
MALFTVVHELAAGLAMGNRRRNYGNWPAPTILEPGWTLTASTCRSSEISISAGDQPQGWAEYDSVMAGLRRTAVPRPALAKRCPVPSKVSHEAPVFAG